MKKLMATLLVLALMPSFMQAVFASPEAQAEPVSLFHNSVGNFDSAPGTQWVLYPGENVVYDPSVGADHPGSIQFKDVDSSGVLGGYAALVYNVPITLEIGKAYDVSFRVYRDPACTNEAIAFRVNIEHEGGSYSYGMDADGNIREWFRLTEFGGWETVNCVYVAPDDERVNDGVLFEWYALGGEGKFWIDDIRLSETLVKATGEKMVWTNEVVSCMEENAPVILLNEENARWLGRTYTDQNERTGIFWTNSGFEVKIEGTGLMAELISNYGPNNAPRIQVYVDGKRWGERVTLPFTGKKGAWIPLVYGLPCGEHTIKVIKLTEAIQSCFWVKGIRLDEGGSLLAPPLPKPRRIEFIGDSITCGYTIERSAKAPDVWDIDKQNGMLTYAAICADNLNADFNCFSLSGWAIYKRGDRRGFFELPAVYSFIAPVNNCMKKWDFSKFVPDVVVVALGTNDSSYVVQNTEHARIFREKYQDFLKQLRGYYPNATIVCTAGMMRKFMYPHIEEAVHSFGDENVYAFQETWFRSSHPIVSDHKQTGDRLSAFIADIMGW